MENWVQGKTILITGGTSGLGQCLADRFLDNGSKVFVIGRNENDVIKKTNYTILRCDFTKLKDIQLLVDQLHTMSLTIDILVLNAGILSPKKYMETPDGFELSYQVNFLSHVLLYKLLSKKSDFKPDLVVNTSSPIYTKGQLDIDKVSNKGDYKLFQSYANSKLFMALFSEKLSNEGMTSFSFNPGTFSSGIYRQQEKWFHSLYKVAAPFMVSADKVADALFHIISSKIWINGKMINKRAKVKTLKAYNSIQKQTFWQYVDEQIEPFVRELNKKTT